jgi:hypothetical protein
MDFLVTSHRASIQRRRKTRKRDMRVRAMMLHATKTRIAEFYNLSNA